MLDATATAPMPYSAADELAGNLSDIDLAIAQLQHLRATRLNETSIGVAHWGHAGSSAEVARLLNLALDHAKSMVA